MAQPHLYVLERDDGWTIRQDGRTCVFASRESAVQAAIEATERSAGGRPAGVVLVQLPDGHWDVVLAPTTKRRRRVSQLQREPVDPGADGS